MFFKCYFIHKWNTWKIISEAKHDDMSDCEVNSFIDEKWIWLTDSKKRVSFIDTLISLMIFTKYESRLKYFYQLLNMISFCNNNSLILLKNLIYSKKFVYLFNYSFNLKCSYIFLRKFKSFFSKMLF